jgi:hypothetical protein
MANTLKFGNGLWATQEGSTLAYNDENDNYKPLPFDFTRASNATVVNKEGLIETVGNGIPRIDFSDSEDGALLLEPSRTNLINYSEDLTQWVQTRVTNTDNETTSPDGSLNASLITEDSTLNTKYTFLNLSTTTNEHTLSFFAKYKGRYLQVLFGTSDTSGNVYINFDLQNGTFNNNGVSNPSIKDFGNGWYKISLSVTPIVTSNFGVLLSLATSLTSSRLASYQGDGTSGVYIWGAQLEAGSYPTSYIPTSGSAVTRLVDNVADMTGLQSKSLLGVNQGTWFVDLKDMFFEITGTGVGSMFLYLDSGNQIEFVPKTNTSFKISLNNSIALDNISGQNKIAISYDSNGLVIYKNGVSKYTTSSSEYSSAYNELHLSQSTRPHRININNMKLYNTRLSNSELQALTTI